ncbi:ABC transporter permease [Halogeometricum limi]|uniref:NitT/TauT family transport system permease protein n=1 Tax=Halogeometricum limi TaxID=555875 RepID=A0A1I6ICA2_9EURY|nr:ABC transporter permease [Halogeometricum limi]SFR64331.1 NitT/TauT family transport system permease protein [Halogeometricum limi]
MATSDKTAIRGIRLPSSLTARIFGILVGLAAWMLLAAVFPNNLMPFPLETLGLAWGLVESGVAWRHLGATLWRTLWGFVGSMILGTAIGVLMGVNNYSRRFFTPYVVIGLSIPAIAWAAVTTLIFGFTLMGPVGATVLTTFPYIAINVWKGVESIENDLVDMSKAFDITRPRMLARLIIPSAAPFLFSGFRFGLAISWKIVTIAEIFAASSGVGYKLMQTYQLYQFETAWAWAILFIIVILIVEYGFVKPLERRVFEYRRDADFALLG